jgi:hypothetical protein
MKTRFLNFSSILKLLLNHYLVTYFQIVCGRGGGGLIFFLKIVEFYNIIKNIQISYELIIVLFYNYYKYKRIVIYNQMI